jgi:hypothetical protein
MIRLFYNYYEDKNPIRKREIDMCLQRNLGNKLITTTILESASKPTYEFFFQQINKITESDDINIICNSDIFFDDTISLVLNMPHKQLYALSRWDWLGNDALTRFFDRPDSQDTWIVKGKVEGVFGNFTLGTRGCDNRIAYEFHRAGYAVSNPSKSIRTYHVHNSGVRNYTFADVVPEPYLTIPTSSL